MNRRTLLRKDEVWSAIPVILAASTMGALFLLVAFAWGRQKGLEPTEFKYLPWLWLSVALPAMLMLPLLIRSRLPKFGFGLPIHCSEWSRLRVLGGLILGWQSLIIVCVTLLLISQATQTRSLLLHGCVLALTWSAFVLIAFTWQPSRPALGWQVLVPLSSAGLGALAISQPVFGWPLLLLVIAFGVYALFNKLPDALTLADSELSEGLFDSQRPLSGKQVLRRALIRYTFWPALMVFLLVTVIWQVGVAGIYAFALFLPLALSGARQSLLSWAAALPIPKPKLATYYLGTSLLAMLAGLLLSETLDGHLDPRDNDIRLRTQSYSDGTESTIVVVPAALKQWVRSSEAKSIEAPWGEVAQVAPEAPIAGLPLYRANPYGMDSASSPRFVAWQISRAVQAAYGVEISPEIIQERYVSTLKGKVIAPFLSLRMEEDFPSLAASMERGPIAPSTFWIKLLIFAGIWYLLHRLEFTWTASTSGSYEQLKNGTLVLILIFTSSFALIFAYSRLQAEREAGRGLLATSATSLENLSSGRPWAICVPILLLVTWLSWRNLRKHFVRSEPNFAPRSHWLTPLIAASTGKR